MTAKERGRERDVKFVQSFPKKELGLHKKQDGKKFCEHVARERERERG